VKQQSEGDKSPQSNYVRVHSNGTCLWWPLYEQSMSHCVIDVTWYPFDDQHCNLSFESWKYDSAMLNVTTRQLPDLYTHYNPNDEWTLLSWSTFCPLFGPIPWGQSINQSKFIF